MTSTLRCHLSVPFFLFQAQITRAFITIGHHQRASIDCNASTRKSVTGLLSSLSEDGDFALIGLNAEAPLNPFEVTNTQTSAFGLQSAEDIMASTSPTGSEESTSPRSTSNKMDATPQKTKSRSDEQISDGLSGLTADGDFIIEGVNAIDPSANQGLEEYGSPLIDPSQGEGDLLSQLSLSQPQEQRATGGEQENSDNVTGLTDDGDIALLGLNAMQPQSSLGGEVDADQTKLLSSLMQGQQAPALPASDVQMGLKAMMPPEPSILEVEDMTMWLQDILPSLTDDDCIYYAENLVALGFHFECVTQSELLLTDLAFMRPLHARYIFHEIKGMTHPPKEVNNYDVDADE